MSAASLSVDAGEWSTGESLMVMEFFVLEYDRTFRSLTCVLPRARRKLEEPVLSTRRSTTASLAGSSTSGLES